MSGLWALLTANVPQLILLLAGVGLLVFEMYIPGFGVPGMLGLGALAAGFVLLRPTAEQGLWLVVLLAAVLLAALVICLLTASRGRIGKSPLALRDVALSPEDGNRELEKFVGMTGTAHTALHPAGIGSFGGERLNVVSDGEFIDRGAGIRVVSVSGNRVVVREEREV